jgi:hypothetical protein
MVRIAGVARNSKYFTLDENNALAWYAPYKQMNRAFWSDSSGYAS